MKKAILIDDEDYCSETLEYELNKSNYNLDIIAKCNDSREAVALIENLNPDIVFLDIEMPWLSGFDVLDQLNSIDFHLIFVTAFDQFALKAFDYFALNYLLKPINNKQLNKTLHKIFSSHPDETKKMTQIIKIMEKARRENDLIALPINNGYEFYSQNDIIRCEADSNYCLIFLSTGKKLLVSKSLKIIQNLLDSRFFRVHQTHLINMNYLKKYDKSNGGSAILKDNTSIPISRLKKADFIKFIQELKN